MLEKATERHYAFAANVATGMDAKSAAIKAGFTEKTAHSKSYSWVGLSRTDSLYPELWDYIQELRQEARSEAVATVQELLEFATTVLRADIAETVQFDGFSSYPVAWEELTKEQRAVIKKFKYKKGEGTELEMYSKMEAFRELMKYHGAYAPVRSELTGKDGGPIEVSNAREKLLDMIKPADE